MQRINKIQHTVNLALLRTWSRLRNEAGAETVEYLGLSAIVVVLGGAVYLFVTGGIGQITAQIGRIMADIINGMAQGW